MIAGQAMATAGMIVSAASIVLALLANVKIGRVERLLDGIPRRRRWWRRS